MAYLAWNHPGGYGDTQPGVPGRSPAAELQSIRKGLCDQYFDIKVDPNPDKPEIRNSPDLIKLAEIRNKFELPKFK